MTLARAMDIFAVLEQPVHESTAGMESLPEFVAMVTFSYTAADSFGAPAWQPLQN